MLLKLIRYEFKCNYSKLSATCLANIFVVIIFSIFSINHPTISTAASIISLIAFNAVGFLFLFQRYAANLYSNEGYMTFTLPVKGHQILLSKLLVACLWLIIFTLASLPNIYLTIYCIDNSYLLKAFKIINSEIPATFFTIVNFIAGLFLNVLLIYFSISVSKLLIWRKFGTLVGFITFFVSSFLVSVPTLLVNKYLISSIHKSSSKNISNIYVELNLYTLAQLIFSIIFSVLLFYLTSYILDRKINLK